MCVHGPSALNPPRKLVAWQGPQESHLSLVAGNGGHN